ncbi:MAG: hypothetical protein LKG39_05190 [Acetobacter sp.]|jgi:hypothetical protein|uniref:hypothetical protein n=1 Tax=Acetobacter sp. TaxID=440 RepID=UPI0025C1C7B1|nr:hypothetical protein [Acetobacter sp.]MCI1315794.1 hypothetical protein [Acetobacter sp.]
MAGSVSLVWLMCWPACAQQAVGPDTSGTVSADSGDSSEDVTKILDRPLFEPDRRRKGVAHEENGEFHLVGISGHAGLWKAIFKPDRGEGKSIVLTGSEKVNDWTIVSIDPGGVNLARGEKTKRISIMFSKNTASLVPEKVKEGEASMTSASGPDSHLAW